MKKGFTLIELLVVILMIGILAGMAMPIYNRAVRRSEMVEGLTNGKTIWESAVRYHSVNSEWPTSFDQLDAGFIGAEVTNNTFDDGNFIYTLVNNETPGYVAAQSTKGDYTIKFMYPTVNSSGVFAPIACCPGESTDAQWLCNNMGIISSTTGMPAGCTEIKG